MDEDPQADQTSSAPDQTSFTPEQTIFLHCRDQKDNMSRDIHSKAKIALDRERSTLLVKLGSSNDSHQGLCRNRDKYGETSGNIHTESNTLVVAPIESVVAGDTIRAWEAGERDLVEKGRKTVPFEPIYTSDTLPEGWFVNDPLKKGSDLEKRLETAYVDICRLRTDNEILRGTEKGRTLVKKYQDEIGQLRTLVAELGGEEGVTSRNKKLTTRISKMAQDMEAMKGTGEGQNLLDKEQRKLRKAYQEIRDLKLERNQLLEDLARPSTQSPSSVPHTDYNSSSDPALRAKNDAILNSILFRFPPPYAPGGFNPRNSPPPPSYQDAVAQPHVRSEDTVILTTEPFSSDFDTSLLPTLSESALDQTPPLTTSFAAPTLSLFSNASPFSNSQPLSVSGFQPDFTIPKSNLPKRQNTGGPTNQTLYRQEVAACHAKVEHATGELIQQLATTFNFTADPLDYKGQQKGQLAHLRKLNDHYEDLCEKWKRFEKIRTSKLSMKALPLPSQVHQGSPLASTSKLSMNSFPSPSQVHQSSPLASTSKLSMTSFPSPSQVHQSSPLASTSQSSTVSPTPAIQDEDAESDYGPEFDYDEEFCAQLANIESKAAPSLVSLPVSNSTSTATSGMDLDQDDLSFGTGPKKKRAKDSWSTEENEGMLKAIGFTVSVAYGTPPQKIRNKGQHCHDRFKQLVPGSTKSSQQVQHKVTTLYKSWDAAAVKLGYKSEGSS